MIAKTLSDLTFTTQTTERQLVTYSDWTQRSPDSIGIGVAFQSSVEQSVVAEYFRVFLWGLNSVGVVFLCGAGWLGCCWFQFGGLSFIVVRQFSCLNWFVSILFQVVFIPFGHHPPLPGFAGAFVGQYVERVWGGIGCAFAEKLSILTILPFLQQGHWSISKPIRVRVMCL